MRTDTRRKCWMVSGWILLLLSALGFHWGAAVMAQAVEPSMGPINEVLRGIVLMHQTVSAWVYLVPAVAAAVPIWLGERLQIDAWLGVLFVVVLVLWYVTFFGILVP